MSEKRRGVTLIELLIAIALMIILTGSLSFTFVTAREVFTRSEATIQVYQNARNAFDVMERELSIAVKTHDMEFFNEPDPDTWNGHYDITERCFGLNVENPAESEEDYAKDPFEYVCAMTIYGQEYPDPRGGRRRHRCDMIYFKSLTTIQGKTRAALVLYKLDLKDPVRPILKKYVLYRGDDIEAPLVQDPPDRTGQDLCLYVKEMKIEYYFDNVLDTERPGFHEVGVDKKRTFCYMGAGATDFESRFKHKEFSGSSYDNFGQLSAGDTVLIFGWESMPKNADYIIDTIMSDGNLTFSMTGTVPMAGIPNLSFRAGYLPPALRITLKIMDTKGTQARTLTRIIKIHSR